MYGNKGTGAEDGSADAIDAPFLPREGVEAWLLKVNKAVGRGTEFRAAEAIMQQAPRDGLTLQGTQNGTEGVEQN